jgi:methylamine---glutamate N-methyltransferase subunit C
MSVYKCEVCGYEFDEEKEGMTWEELPEEWKCPLWCAEKKSFHIIDSDDEE